MKALMLTDTHLGRKNHNKFWSDLTEDLFDEIIDYCIREDIDKVFHLGDFFDSKKSLNVLTINKGIDICQKFDNNKILLDTGAGKGGILSAIDLETKEVYSTSNNNPIASFLF